MARIFLSHSSRDNAQARALANWLASNGWPADDVFLDIDPKGGIAPGERWQKALNDAAGRCEAVLFLISKNWLASRWCLEELSLAHKLNKRLFGVLIDTVKLDDVPSRLRDEWQLIDLENGRDGVRLDVTLPSGKDGHATFSRAGLERLRIGLVKAGLDPSHFDWPPASELDRAPYRGLAPMEAEDAGIFYGREAATIAVLDQLRGLAEMSPPRLLAILGASGAGKSSFMRAGLIPRLRRDSHHFLVLPIMRPQRAAISGETGFVASLAAAGKALQWTRARVAKAVEAGVDDVSALLAELLEAPDVPPAKGRGPPTILVPLDQAEELFIADGREESKAALALLTELMKRGELAVLATIRTDSYGGMQTTLADIKQSAFSLTPMARGAYQRVIEGPAERLAGSDRALKIDPALTEALMSDIEYGGAKDALPLLAFALERLYLEHGADGDLTLAEYEESGRISGAIEAAVERALAASANDPKVPQDKPAKLALLRRAMIPWLAGIDPETKSARRFVAKFSDLPEETRPLVHHFIEQRLLSTDVDANGERTVEPAHEALLRQWGLIDGWLKEDIAILATLEGVRRAARDWTANARSDGWLAHAGTRLEDAGTIQTRPDLARRLEPDDLAYLAACRAAESARVAKERRSARLIRFAAIAATLLAFVAAGAAWWGNERAGEAEEQRSEAASQLRQAQIAESRFLASTARSALQKGETELAANLALYALPQRFPPDSGARPFVTDAAQALYAAIDNDRLKVVFSYRNFLVSPDYRSPDRSIAFSPDGALILGLASSTTARAWSALSGSVIASFIGDSPITGFALSKKANTWAVAREAGVIQLLRANSLELIQTVRIGESKLGKIGLAPDGRKMAIVADDASAIIWDIAAGRKLADLRGHSGVVNSIAYSPDGKWVATGSEDKTARIWDSESGQLLYALTHPSAIYRVVFSPDSGFLATGSKDRLSTIWRVRDAEELDWKNGFLPPDPFSTNQEESRFTTLLGASARQWLTTGRDLAAAMFGMIEAIGDEDPDRMAERLNAAADKPVQSFDGGGGWIYSSDFSPDGKWLATGSQTGLVQLWDLSSGDGKPINLAGHGRPVETVVFSPDGKYVATAGRDQTVRVWRVEDTKSVQGGSRSEGISDWIDRANASIVRPLADNERSANFLTPRNDQRLVKTLPGANECDRIASHPYDLQALAGGHGFQIVAEDAVSVCKAQLEAGASTPRLRFLLGRALQRAGSYIGAIENFKVAADAGYPMAYNNLAIAYRYGEGARPDRVKARALFAEALSRGAYIAGAPLGQMHWHGEGGPVDKAKAISIWIDAAAKGDPFSHERLAWVAELGRDGSASDLPKALYHYAVAVKLMEEAGDDESAVAPRYRRASLARIQEPEVVAQKWREAMAFQGPKSYQAGQPQ
jgi:WD40 repeat protein